MKIILALFFFFFFSYLFASSTEKVSSLNFSDKKSNNNIRPWTDRSDKDFVQQNIQFVNNQSAIVAFNKNKSLSQENSDLKKKLNDLEQKYVILKRSSDKKVSQSQRSFFSTESSSTIDLKERDCSSHNEFLSLIQENEEAIAKYDDNINELKEKNKELKEDNEFYQEKLLNYNNFFELQNKKLIDLEEEIEHGQDLIQFQDGQLKKQDNQILFLNQKNEDLQNKINLLLSQVNQKKDKFSISGMGDIQINNSEKQKELFLKSNIFFYSINEVELEVERDRSLVEYCYSNLEICADSNKKPCKKNLHDELKNCFLGVNNFSSSEIKPTKFLFEDNFAYPIEVNENNFKEKKVEDVACQTDEKKFKDSATQTELEAELEKEIEESFILSVIKKNKKLFLSLGSISLIATLFYLKKEKLIYWYGFLPRISSVF